MGAPPERNAGIAAHARDMRRQMGLEIARGRAIRTATRTLRKSPDDAARAPIAKLNLPGPKAELRFPVGQASRAFYRRFWPGTGPAEWNDWRWQMRARIRTLDELARIFRLSEDEYAAVSRHQGALPVAEREYPLRAPYLAFIYGNCRRQGDFERYAALVGNARVLDEERLLIEQGREALMRPIMPVRTDIPAHRPHKFDPGI